MTVGSLHRRRAIPKLGVTLLGEQPVSHSPVGPKGGGPIPVPMNDSNFDPIQLSAADTLDVQGQTHAVWTHCLSDKEVALIREADIPTMVIHGRHDLMAHPPFGEHLARRCPRLPSHPAPPLKGHAKSRALFDMPIVEPLMRT